MSAHPSCEVVISGTFSIAANLATVDSSLTGIGSVLTGFLLAAVGLVGVALSLIRRRGVDPLLMSFGLFSLLYGLRLFVDNPLAPNLMLSSELTRWVASFITYLISIPAWYFFWMQMGDGWHSLNRRWVRLVTVFAVVGVVSDVIRGRPGTLMNLNNVIVILGLIVIVIGFWTHRARMTTDLKILAFGLTVFGLLAVNDNVMMLNILPWTWEGESIGFVVFVGCLGWIAARRFFATEHDLATVEGELEAAKRIQRSILPKAFPENENLAIAVRFHPSSAVAGDFYDFLSRDSGKVGILIADVSGHGVPAALIASMVKVAVKAHADSAGHPSELLTRVNQTLCGSFEHGFVTAACVFIDVERREATISCGGHPYPLLRRKTEASVREIGTGGIVLGRFADADYGQERLALEPGDRLVLYTDGIVEAREPGGEVFGEQRLHRLLVDTDGQSAEEFCDSVMREIDRWTSGQTDTLQDDDLTLVVVDLML